MARQEVGLCVVAVIASRDASDGTAPGWLVYLSCPRFGCLTKIEVQGRDQILEPGVDPLRDADAVRALVEEALEEWDERALVGAVAPVADREATAKWVVDDVVGLGPLQKYLDDPEVEEIWINEPS